jgi:hypothetical protein
VFSCYLISIREIITLCFGKYLTEEYYDNIDIGKIYYTKIYDGVQNLSWRLFLLKT